MGKVMVLIGTLLLIGGLLSLVFGGVPMENEKGSAEIGDMEISVTETETVGVSRPVGIGAAVLGGVLLIVGLATKSGR